MSDILFAEDDADVRKWVAIALESEGYAVRTVEDGEAALAACATKRPDVLILDVMMPKRDGLSVCSEIRRTDSRHATRNATRSRGLVPVPTTT